ncbi:MAG: FecR domain-containing protein [Acidobacteriota bacterium]
MRIGRLTLSLLIIFSAALVVLADDKKKSIPDEGLYTVSAKAGIVSIISGDVTFKRDASDWQTLIEGDDLKPNDMIKTGATGRAEILLNPGTYLRIGENSEVVFPDLSNFRLQVNLLKGSAILEAGLIDVSLRMKTPQYVFTIAQSGIYRFNVDPNGKSEMLVRKGKIKVAGAEVKSGKIVSIDNAPPTIQKFDKKVEDTFDTWSKDRARTIIAANRKLSKDRMRSSLRSAHFNGLWVYDPFFRSYTFLPGWNGFNSPYGGSYSFYNPYYNPWAYNGNNNGNNGGWNGGGNTGGSGTTSGNTGSGANRPGGSSSGGMNGGPMSGAGRGRITDSTRKGSPNDN